MKKKETGSQSEMKMYDLVAKIGDVATENGQKTRWARVGVMVEKEGKFNIKLDALPVGSDWNG